MNLVKNYALGASILSALGILDAISLLLHHGFMEPGNCLIGGIEAIWFFISIAAIVLFVCNKAPLLSPTSFVAYILLFRGALLVHPSALSSSTVPNWISWSSLVFAVYYLTINLSLAKSTETIQFVVTSTNRRLELFAFSSYLFLLIAYTNCLCEMLKVNHINFGLQILTFSFLAFIMVLILYCSLPHLLFFLGNPNAAENLCIRFRQLRFIPGKLIFELCQASILASQKHSEESIVIYDGILQKMLSQPFGKVYANVIQEERLEVLKATGKTDSSLTNHQLKKSHISGNIYRTIQSVVTVAIIFFSIQILHHANHLLRTLSITAYNSGYAYDVLGQYEKAINDYTKAISLDPQNFRAYDNRANAYNILCQYQRAIDDSGKAISINPRDAWAYNNRGNTYLGLGHYQKAIDDYNKAISLDPTDIRASVTAYDGLGLTYQQMGQYQNAVNGYSKAISINPRYARIYKDRADAYDKLGKHDLAEKDRQKAKELGFKPKQK